MTDEKQKRQHRRGRGEGSISKVPGRDLWRARLTAGRDAQGKLIRKTVYGPTKRDVQEKLTRLQNEKLDGKLLAVGRLTVKELLDRWLEYWKPNISAGTRREYRNKADRFIIPNIGEHEVAKLRPMHVQSFMDKLAADNVGARTRAYVFTTLRCALNAAVDRDLIAANPCRKSMIPKHKPREAVALTVDQARAIIDAAAGTRWEALLSLAIGSGLRQGELFALSWDDIDLDAGTITVRHSLEEVGKSLTLKAPKSEAGRRVVGIDSRTIEALHVHRRLMLAEGNAGSQWVFPDTEGNPLRKSNFFRSCWKLVRKDAGLEGVRFHDLRHTHITWLVDDNVPLKEVQAQAGHSAPQMVMRYAHRTKHSQDRARSAIESRMAATNSCDPIVTHNGGTDETAKAS